METYFSRDLYLRDAKDEQIFQQARHQGIVIISKDSELIEIVLRLDIPPRHLWVACGNVSNRRLQNLLAQVFLKAQQLLVSFKSVVEIAGLAALQTT
ncbi:MAG: hypothetical protein PHO08_20180 [Methylococcales bacterium]|nr:hypothetical protein [Methylococcales bacterium]